MSQSGADAATVPGQGRALGWALIACAVATVALLANHPGGAAHSFAEMLHNEAANQVSDAVVHGGFIAVMAVELVCFAGLAVRLGPVRTPVLAAMIFTAAGFLALAGSMIVDGLVTPALAARYVAGPADQLDAARLLLALCGALIRFLMPMGLAFQAAGTVAWGAAFLSGRGLARATGVGGLVLGAAILIGLAATAAGLNPLVLMGALAGQAMWIVAVGLTLSQGRSEGWYAS